MSLHVIIPRQEKLTFLTQKVQTDQPNYAFLLMTIQKVAYNYNGGIVLKESPLHKYKERKDQRQQLRTSSQRKNPDCFRMAGVEMLKISKADTK